MAESLFVCGLGNPGPEYQHTRHNLGFWVVELLCERARGRWRLPCEQYTQCRVTMGRASVTLVEPLTYMNLTGRAVGRFASGEGFDPATLLAVCDDTALPLGRLRLRKKGSDGGHNGLASIIDALGTSEFPRLRLGVGPVPEGADQSDFVLAAFAEAEVETARAMAARAADCVEYWVRKGIDAAMTRFNTRGADVLLGGQDPANGD
jgi:PTH1 family peptidyl-tRNA hydrolase